MFFRVTVMRGQHDEGSQLGMGAWKRLNSCETSSQQPQGCCFGNAHWECCFPTPQAQLSLSFSLSEHRQSSNQVATPHPRMLPKYRCLRTFRVTPRHPTPMPVIHQGSDICQYHETGKTPRGFPVTVAGWPGKVREGDGARANPGLGQLLAWD